MYSQLGEQEMKRLMGLGLLLICSSSFAMEQTDYRCQAECTQKGGSYGYCHAQCTMADPNACSPCGATGVAPHPIKSTDFKCMRECQDKGFLYNYCLDKCSY